MTAVASVSRLAPWQAMSVLAVVLLLVFKVLTLAQFQRPIRRRDALAYLCTWPGLDADEFFSPTTPADRPHINEWLFALGKTSLGAAVVWGAVPLLFTIDLPWLAGVVGFAGLVLLLHFGIFHVLALVWRTAGRNVRPIMDRPFAATSLTDFWGRRWNRAYRRVSHDLFFRPARERFGAKAGLVFAFLASGIIHDLVLSVPAGAGYGLPTLYFLLQATGMLVERTQAVRRAAARLPFLGRIYAAAFLLLPLGWLFHRAFLTGVMVPFLRAIGA